MRYSIFSALILAAFCLPADPSDGGPIRNEEDLAKAMEQLREKYRPSLQSIPGKVEVRTRRDLCSETWRARYEMGEGAYEVGQAGADPPPMKQWYGTGLDDSNWDSVTVPEWRFKTGRPGGRKRKPVPYGCVLWYRTSFEVVFCGTERHSTVTRFGVTSGCSLCSRVSTGLRRSG